MKAGHGVPVPDRHEQPVALVRLDVKIHAPGGVVRRHAVAPLLHDLAFDGTAQRINIVRAHAEPDAAHAGLEARLLGLLNERHHAMHGADHGQRAGGDRARRVAKQKERRNERQDQHAKRRRPDQKLREQGQPRQ